MDLQSIKNIPITLVMKWYHITVARKYGNSEFYFAPWRDEKTPSLKVDIVKNLWIDFGEPERSGSCIDLVMNIENCSFNQACEKLENFYGGTDFSSRPSSIESPIKKILNEQSPYTILREGKIEDLAFINYIMQERKIPLDVAQKYLNQLEIEHRHVHKKSAVIGFKNNSGGYEIRGLNSFKSSIGHKDFSFIDNGANKTKLLVVEGMFDMLSAIVMKEKLFNKNETVDYLVLNSLSMLEKSKEEMFQYDQVYLALDWDFMGRVKTNTLCSLSDKFINLSAKFQNQEGKDLNDFLRNQQSNEKQRGLKR
ncbi:MULTISPECIES: toprim domain-containing protein [Chitinophagaceae]